MQLRQTDLNLFVVFDVLYSERSVTRAADRLHLSQPAVSNALRRLRELFDDPLFVWRAQAMTPTPVARNVAGSIRNALLSLETTVSGSRQFDPATSDRNFVIGMPALVQALLLPRLVPRLRKEAPNVTLACVNVPRRDLEKELASGRVDIALDVPHPTSRRLLQTQLLRDRYVCVMSHSHSLAGESMTLDSYLANPHVQVSARKRGLGHVDIALARLGLKRKIHLWLSDYATAISVLADSDLLLTLPRALVQHGKLQMVELPFTVNALDWCMLWDESADDEASNRWIRDQVARLF